MPLSGGLGLSPTGGVLLTRSAQRHLALLAAAFLLLLAVGAWLDIPRALTTPAGNRPRRVVHGRGGALPRGTRRSPAVSLLGAVLAVRRGVRRG